MKTKSIINVAVFLFLFLFIGCSNKEEEIYPHVEYTIYGNPLDIPAEGGKFSISLKSNVDWYMEDIDFDCVISPSYGKANVPYTVYVKVPATDIFAEDDYDFLYRSITCYSADDNRTLFDVNIDQYKVKPVLELETKEVRFTKNGGQKSVSIISSTYPKVESSYYTIKTSLTHESGNKYKLTLKADKVIGQQNGSMLTKVTVSNGYETKTILVFQELS